MQNEVNGRLYHVLGLPRDAQGRKLKTKNAFGGRGVNRAAYYRVIRPASGFSSKDMSSDSTLLYHINPCFKALNRKALVSPELVCNQA